MTISTNGRPPAVPDAFPARPGSPSPDDAAVGAVVVRVAEAVSSRLLEVTAGMRESLGGAIAELVGDGPLLALLGRAVEGNVATVLAMLRERTPLHEVEVPGAAVAHARRLAEQGVPVFAMVRAYRLGQAYLLEECYRELVDDGPDVPSSLSAYNAINGAITAYIDWVSQEVVTVYETERDQWVRNQDAVRVARVHEVLERGDGGDTHEAEVALRYRLRQHHVAAILWSTEETSIGSLGRLETAVAALAADLGSAGTPLTMSADRSTAWAWFPRGTDDTDPDVDRLEQSLRAVDIGDVRVAVGGTSHGVDGFRDSHHESLAARHVLQVGGDATRRVIGYREAGVPAAAVLADSVESTRTLVRGALGALAADDPSCERLRDTLLAFLECGSSYTAAAARLTLHKNSVKYRVERALELRGRPLGDDRIDVGLALVACRWLRPHRSPAAPAAATVRSSRSHPVP